MEFFIIGHLFNCPIFMFSLFVTGMFDNKPLFYKCCLFLPILHLGSQRKPRLGGPIQFC